MSVAHRKFEIRGFHTFRIAQVGAFQTGTWTAFWKLPFYSNSGSMFGGGGLQDLVKGPTLRTTERKILL